MRPHATTSTGRSSAARRPWPAWRRRWSHSGCSTRPRNSICGARTRTSSTRCGLRAGEPATWWSWAAENNWQTALGGLWRTPVPARNRRRHDGRHGVPGSTRKGEAGTGHRRPEARFHRQGCCGAEGRQPVGRTGAPMTRAAVSQLAGVSRSFTYQNDQARTIIAAAQTRTNASAESRMETMTAQLGVVMAGAGPQRRGPGAQAPP